ncbi:nuclear transport factor 2 family protein [Nocardioides immobilis]|nr:nuclear transport factor 2 family protein [Nocardioides immobilis]
MDDPGPGRSPRRLEQCADQLEIHELSYRYAHASDQHDYELLSTVFTPDGVLTYENSWTDPENPTVAIFKGTESLRTMPKPPLSRGMHVATNIIVDFGKDDATGSVYFVRLMADADRGHRVSSCGLYWDRYERTSDGWRIAYREVRPFPPSGATASWFLPPTK